MKDYKGQRFGKLVVKEFYHRKNNSYYWNCICDCGNEKIIRITNLTSGATNSCGCLKNKDLTGKRFGKLEVKELSSKENGSKWLCVCDCGKELIVKQNNLLSNNTRSCGCLFIEIHKIGNPKHNLYHTRIYKIWSAMKNRCYLKTHVAYKRYGGRGITICDEWKNNVENFYNWSMENGYEENLTIDRIDNNKGYSPDNCRWVTPLEQQNNTRKNIYYEYNGEKFTLSQICRKYNINYSTLSHRLEKNNDIKKAIETPINKSKSRKKEEK